MHREGDDLVLEVFAGLRKVDQGGDFPEVGARLLGGGEPVDARGRGAPRRCGDPLDGRAAPVPRLRGPDGPDPPVCAVDRVLAARARDAAQRRTTNGAGRPSWRVTARPREPCRSATVALRWVATPEGVQLVVSDEQPPRRTGAVVRRFETAPGRLAPRGRRARRRPRSLIAPGQTRCPAPGTETEWVFELTTDPWKLGPAPAPTGGYRLAVTVRRDRAAGDASRTRCATGCRSPRSTSCTARPCGAARTVGSCCGSILRSSDQEAGPWSQHQLQRSYRAVSEPLDPGLVYFQSFLGQSPTDHPAAIQAELHRVLGERASTGRADALGGAGLLDARPGRRGAGAAPQP